MKLIILRNNQKSLILKKKKLDILKAKKYFGRTHNKLVRNATYK